MKSRSFHPVMALITFMLALLGLVSGCVGTQPNGNNSIEEVDTASNEISFTEEEVQTIVDEIMSGDYSSLAAFSNEEREAFVDALQEYDISLEDIEDVEETDGAVPPPLATCTGYWGIYAYAEFVEQRNSTSGLLYQVSSNCYMWAADTDGDGKGDCGEDYDDYMVSFYFGYHNESASTLKGMLKWTSSSSVVRAMMGTLEGRLYEQTAGGSADNYNFYACVDDFYGGYLETFKLRKY